MILGLYLVGVFIAMFVVDSIQDLVVGNVKCYQARKRYRQYKKIQ
jgi:hypothetical protein